MRGQHPVECPPAHCQCVRAAAKRLAEQNLWPCIPPRARPLLPARQRVQDWHRCALTTYTRGWHLQAPEDGLGPSVSAQHEAQDLLEAKQQQRLREAREQRKASRARCAPAVRGNLNAH